MLHFGGWKKLNNSEVSKEIFNKEVAKIKISAENILDVYGFFRAIGNYICFSGLGGCKVSNFSHILIRDPKSLEVVEDGKVDLCNFICFTFKLSRNLNFE